MQTDDFLWRLTWARQLKKPRDGTVLVADTAELCERVAREMADAKIVGVDTETYGCDPRKEHPKGKARAISIQFSYRVQKNLRKVFVPLWDDNRRLLKIFKPFLEEERKTKCLHNSKYDMHVLANEKIRMRGLLGDTLVMDFLHNTGEMFHGLKECIRRYFDEDTIEYKDTFKQPKLKKNGEPGKSFYVPSLTEVVQTEDGVSRLIKYAASDPAYTVRLYEYLAPKLAAVPWTKHGHYLDYYEKFELPFTDVLFEVERRGCLLDQGRLESVRVDVTKKIVQVEQDFFQECVIQGVPPSRLEKFNLGSGPQVAVLFSEAFLNGRIDKFTPTGKVSTDDESLKAVKGKGAKKVAEIILEHRALKKMLKTYVQPFQAFAKDPAYNGRVHTNLKQTGAATMRLSSSTPNLQNVPTLENDPYGIRECFIAPDGMELCDADLSQIELRVAAHYTADETLTKLLNEGWDQHSMTATKDKEVRAWVGARAITKDLLGELKEKFPDARKRAKVLNFGCLYGLGPMGYMAKTGCSQREAEDAINGFFAVYPGLKTGIKRVHHECKANGSIRTLLQRYCHIPDINSPVPKFRSGAERKSWSYKIQGSAGDLIKMSMLLVEQDERLKKWGVKMILQIHDELLFEVPKGLRKEAGAVINEIVSHPYRAYGFKDLKLDTPANVGWGSSWANAK